MTPGYLLPVEWPSSITTVHDFLLLYIWGLAKAGADERMRFLSLTDFSAASDGCALGAVLNINVAGRCATQVAHKYPPALPHPPPSLPPTSLPQTHFRSEMYDRRCTCTQASGRNPDIMMVHQPHQPQPGLLLGGGGGAAPVVLSF